MQLEESEEQYTQAERRIHTLISSLDEKEKELCSAAQKLQGSLSTSAAYETTIKQLEQDMQRYAQTHVVHAKHGYVINLNCQMNILKMYIQSKMLQV